MKDGALFVTGGSGFVGRHFLRALEAAHAGPIHALVRSAAPERSAASGIRWVRGELGDAESYREALHGCDQVVHLAALTGKGLREEHFRVNTEGTRRLVEACRAAAVRRFVHVSTIAAGYPEKRFYPYAAAKAEAEDIVRASGLEHAIVRPTIVLGPGSPALGAMRGLAGLPIIPLFGARTHRGTAIVQPIDVADLADCLVDLLSLPELSGECLELGGPEVLSFEDLLRRLHRRLRGEDGRGLRLPVRPLIALLAGMETLPWPRLPVTAGQFYAFLYDSVAAPNRLQERWAGRMRDVSAIFERSLADG